MQTFGFRSFSNVQRKLCRNKQVALEEMSILSFYSHLCNISNRSSHNRRVGNLLDLSGDPVEVPPALAGQPPAAVRRVLLHPLERLEGLEALARHRAGSGAPVARLGTVVPADWNSDERSLVNKKSRVGLSSHSIQYTRNRLQSNHL